MDTARPRGKPEGLLGSAHVRVHTGCFTWFVFSPVFTDLDTMRFRVGAPETVNDGEMSKWLASGSTPGKEQRPSARPPHFPHVCPLSD